MHCCLVLGDTGWRPKWFARDSIPSNRSSVIQIDCRPLNSATVKELKSFCSEQLEGLGLLSQQHALCFHSEVLPEALNALLCGTASRACKINVTARRGFSTRTPTKSQKEDINASRKIQRVESAEAQRHPIESPSRSRCHQSS